MKANELIWPYNLLAKINKKVDAKDKLPECEDDAPEDIEEVMEYIFARLRRSSRKSKILGSTFIQEYYRYDTKMKEIAEEFGLTRSCVSLYINDTMAAIGKCLVYRDMIRLGIAYNMSRGFRSARKEGYDIGYEHGYAAGQHLIIETSKIFRDSPIEDCDFTVRTYNALKRAGIDTVDEVLSVGDENLMKIRNLGKKCLEEIHGFIDDFNASEAEEES